MNKTIFNIFVIQTIFIYFLDRKFYFLIKKNINSFMINELYKIKKIINLKKTIDIDYSQINKLIILNE